MPGVTSPLAGRKPGDIDMMIVRENTEGEYSSVGGRMFPNTDREFVTQQSVMTRVGVDRVLKFAYELARRRPRKKLTSATKSSSISITMPYWDERVAAVAESYKTSQLICFISTSWSRILCNVTIGLTLSWRLICSATFCLIWGQPAPAQSALRHQAISIQSVNFRHFSNRFTIRARYCRKRYCQPNWPFGRCHDA